MINIKSKALSNSKIYLSIFNNEDFSPMKIDSLQMVSGKCTVSGKIIQPSSYARLHISYQGKELSNDFLLDSGNNDITIDTPITTGRSMTLQSTARGNLIFAELNDYFYKATESTRVDGRLKISAEFYKKIDNEQRVLLKKYPDDFASLLLLYRLSKSDKSSQATADNLATLATFSEKLRNSVLGKEFYDEQTRLIGGKLAAKVGNPVPIFKIWNTDNTLFSNSSLAGQPYVIVFSATWCGPCQEQLPKLKKLYKNYKQKGLKVIYFNDDNDLVRWKEHISKNKLTWINVSEKLKPSQSKIPKSFGIYAIPSCFIVDKKGTIIYNSDQSDIGLNSIENFIKKAIDD